MKYHVNAQALSVQYPLQSESALNELSLKINPGEFVVIAGPSGSGKSTFCRTLIGLIPNLTKGDITGGSLEVCGLNPFESQVYQITQHVGMVFQDPETNIFSLIVLDELAFGPENMGLDKSEIIQRIENVSDWIGINDLWARRTDQLSGGQKQRVAIAGTLAMAPKMLILDEPTTDLDPIGKKQVVSTLAHLKKTLGLTTVVIEHDLSNLLEVADRLVILGKRGDILLNDSPQKVLGEGYDEIRELGIRIPSFAAVGHALRRRGNKINKIPMNKYDALQLLSDLSTDQETLLTDLEISLPPQMQSTASSAIQISGLNFHYNKKNPILKDVELNIKQSEFVAIVGPNGSGKSTLLKLIVGLFKSRKGMIKVWDRDQNIVPKKKRTDKVSFVFQDPNHQLFESTVWEEVAFGLRVRKESEETIESRVTKVLEKVNLLHYRDRHPATLSRGEKRRLAVATALSYPIDILLLDEPTTGQDRRTLEGLFKILKRLNKEDGTTVVFVTHDMHTVWKYASQIIGLRDGNVILDGPTRKVLHPDNEDLLKQLEIELPLEANLVSLKSQAPSM
jgi:energy-coupling factor transporter ATP-binding protein EcfA2